MPDFIGDVPNNSYEAHLAFRLYVLYYALIEIKRLRRLPYICSRTIRKLPSRGHIAYNVHNHMNVIRRMGPSVSYSWSRVLQPNVLNMQVCLSLGLNIKSAVLSNSWLLNKTFLVCSVLKLWAIVHKTSTYRATIYCNGISIFPLLPYIDE